MKPSTLIAALIGLAIGVITTIKISNLSENDPDSFKSKEEWALMQSIELDFRDKPITSVEFLDKDNYHLICVPDRGTRLWIMLDPHSAPYYKQMPGDQNYAISETDCDKIEGTHFANLTVMACLESHIGDTLSVSK